MSFERERSCSMCKEVMDLTDQQFKPCKCGYEICVWCWHRVVQIAEKDNTVGLCPACRSPYDKEKILATTISSERLGELSSKKKQKLQKKCKEMENRPAEVTSEKKQNLQKTKLELEVRNALSDVRIKQRNLVYVANMPIELANEETLQKKDFFGQYGKVTRVDVPRSDTCKKLYPSTCVVFIKFSKEEEASRCIKAVNGCILDGRHLKASVGFTGYCKTWLSTMRCVNPDCPFLHELARQEDICRKDELTSACVSKGQQWPGISFNNYGRSLGRCLPPPEDDCSRNCLTTSKPLVQSAVHDSAFDVGNSLQNSDTTRSGVLLATTSRDLRNASQGPCTTKESASKLDNRILEGLPTSPIYPSMLTGMSEKGHKMSNSAPFGRGSEDMKFPSMEYCSGNHRMAQKDLVQGPDVLHKVNGGSKEDSVTSDMISLNLGLVEPHRLAKQCGDANKKTKFLESLDSHRAENSDTGRGLNSNVLDRRKISDHMDIGGQKEVNSNNSPIATAYEKNSYEVPKNSHIILDSKGANEAQLTSSVQHSASCISRPPVCPPPRYPPGFLPRHAAVPGQPFPRPAYSGHSDQDQFQEYPPCASLSRSNYTTCLRLEYSQPQFQTMRFSVDQGTVRVVDNSIPLQKPMENSATPSTSSNFSYFYYS